MPVRFDDAGKAADFLKQVAAQSYGSGRFEGAKGGFGSIGMIGGKPVKFNTHWKDSFGKATSEMINSSNELRESLGAAAKVLCDKDVQKDALGKILKTLGLTDDSEGANKSLLSRKVVANVLRQIDKVIGQNSFKDVAALSSKGVETKFASVKAAAAAAVKISATIQTACAWLVSGKQQRKEEANAMTAAFGMTAAEQEKTIARKLLSNPTALAMLNPRPLTEGDKDFIASQIRDLTKRSFESALKEMDNAGFAQECLRSSTAHNIYAATKINGEHVAPGPLTDNKFFIKLPKGQGQWLGGHDPNTICGGRHASFFSKLADLIPATNENRTAIMKMLTSQMGLQGLPGDLSVLCGESDKDFFGFGNPSAVMAGKDGIRIGGYAPNGIWTSRDISIVDNEIVMKQHSGFGPQIDTLDNVVIKPPQVGGLQEADMSIYEVTKTIHIPLKQPKVDAGQMPKYSIDVDIKRHVDSDDGLEDEVARNNRYSTGYLTSGDIKALNAKPMGTPVTVTAKIPNDLDRLQASFNKSNTVEIRNGDCALMGLTDFFSRGYVYEIGGQVMSLPKGSDPNAVKDGVQEMRNAAKMLFDSDADMLNVFDEVFRTSITNLESSHSLDTKGVTLLPAALGEGVSASVEQSLKLSKNDDGSYHVDYHKGATGVKQYMFANESGIHVIERDDGKKNDSWEMSLSFDIKRDNDGKIVVSSSGDVSTVRFQLPEEGFKSIQ